MNSKSHIANELNNIKDTTSNPKIVTDKENGLEKLLEKNIKTIEDNINRRIINIYERPWKKLENKLKLHKIKEYCKDNNINETDCLFITKYYTDKKKISIEYDMNNCKITQITYSMN